MILNQNLMKKILSPN